jgi:hypothetical protein
MKNLEREISPKIKSDIYKLDNSSKTKEFSFFMYILETLKLTKVDELTKHKLSLIEVNYLIEIF